MAKLTAWLVTLIGLVYTLPLLGVDVVSANLSAWIIALSFLVIGVTKLARNYKLMK